MERRYDRWEITGLLLTMAAGSLLHFVYEWSGHHPVAAAFAAINESTWEHMKLLAVPWLVWTAAEALLAGEKGGAALFPRTLGLLAGLGAIPTLYYTILGVTGRGHHMISILLFHLAVLLAFAVSRRTRRSGQFAGRGWQIAGGVTLAAVWLLFLRWTYHTPPSLPVFMDPVTGFAGMTK